MNPLYEILNIFIDPAEAAKQMDGKFAWVAPVVLQSIAAIIVGMMMSPIAIAVMRSNPPGNLSGEQLQRALDMMETVSKAQLVIAPLIIVAMIALVALVLFAASAVMDAKGSFGRLFTFVAHAGLVLTVGSNRDNDRLEIQGRNLFHEGIDAVIWAGHVSG